MARRHYGRELWEDLCDFVREPDGLLAYPFGSWTVQKLFFLCHYLGLTTHAMVGNPSFESVNYIDLFCGPGVCEVKGEVAHIRRYPGSALLAAGCRKPFSNMFLVDRESEALEALRTRIDRVGCSAHVHCWCGDANAVIDEITGAIPARSLNIAFIDPFSLNIHYETIRKLAARRPMDLIILFADRIDIERNVDEYYYPQRSDNLDLFLGNDSNWRSRWNQLENRDGGRIREFFAEIYLQQLSQLGYRHTRTKIINSDRGPLYRLVYASKHERGLKFWDIAESEDVDRQRSLWGI